MLFYSYWECVIYSARKQKLPRQRFRIGVLSLLNPTRLISPGIERKQQFREHNNRLWTMCHGFNPQPTQTLRYVDDTLVIINTKSRTSPKTWMHDTVIKFTMEKEMKGELVTTHGLRDSNFLQTHPYWTVFEFCLSPGWMDGWMDSNGRTYKPLWATCMLRPDGEICTLEKVVALIVSPGCSSSILYSIEEDHCGKLERSPHWSSKPTCMLVTACGWDKSKMAGKAEW